MLSIKYVLSTLVEIKEALQNKVLSGDCQVKNIKDPFPELGFIPRSGLKNVTLDDFSADP